MTIARSLTFSLSPSLSPVISIVFLGDSATSECSVLRRGDGWRERERDYTALINCNGPPPVHFTQGLLLLLSRTSLYRVQPSIPDCDQPAGLLVQSLPPGGTVPSSYNLGESSFHDDVHGFTKRLALFSTPVNILCFFKKKLISSPHTHDS